MQPIQQILKLLETQQGLLQRALVHLEGKNQSDMTNKHDEAEAERNRKCANLAATSSKPVASKKTNRDKTAATSRPPPSYAIIRNNHQISPGKEGVGNRYPKNRTLVTSSDSFIPDKSNDNKTPLVSNTEKSGEVRLI